MRRALAVFRTLRGRLVLLVCFATLPALLFTLYAAGNERTAALGRIEREARLLAQLASREHAHQLEGAKTLLIRLARALERDEVGGRSRSCPGYFPALLAGYPQFTTIGILSVEGELLCSAHPAPEAPSFAENTAFRRALGSREVEVGEYTLGPVVHRPVLHLAYAIRDTDGAPRGVLFVGLDLRWIDEVLQQGDLPQEYGLLIVDRHGGVLGRSERTTSPGGGGPGVVDLAPVATGSEPMVADLPGTGRRFLVGAPMRGVEGVSVVASLPYARVHAEANRVFYRTAAALALLTIFTIACVLFAAEISVLRVLRGLSRAARRFGEGDLATRAEVPSGHGELADLTRAFNAMADALAARQREVAAAKEAEAGRIARELHDELGQTLTSVKIDVAALERALALRATGTSPADRPPHGAATAFGDTVSEIGRRLDDAVAAIRRISGDLRPPVLDRLGLTAALQAQVREFEQRTRLAIVLDVDVDEPVEWLPAITLYRIAGEALTNVVRHADATMVSITLRQEGSAYLLEVKDDGRGIAPAEANAAGSLGVAGMRERCQLVGGTFAIAGRPGAGTTIRVSIPRQVSRDPDAHPAR